MRSGKTIRTFVLLFVLALLMCATESDIAGGAGGETTNGIVVTALMPEDTPVAGAVVRLRRSDYLADTATSLGKTCLTHVDTTTGSDGTVVIHPVDSGSYVLELADNDGYAAMSRFTYDGISAEVELNLRPTATVSGVVSAAEPIQGSVHVLVYGLERHVIVNAATGAFVLDDLPAGNHTLRILPSSSELTPKNTLIPPLAAGQNLTLDTVTLTGFMDEQYARDWAFSRTIRINTSRTGAAVPGDVLDFPLLVELDSAFAFADAEPNGEDIRFAKSDGTRLRYEIEHWDGTNRHAAIWVAMDTVRGGDTTQTFTMYWGRPGAHDYSRGAHVFPTPFVAVWHFGRAPADANAHICHDATGNGHNAVSDGTLTLAPGAVGLAGSFGADTADALHASAPDDALDIDTEALTLSLWLYLDRGLAEQLPVAKGFPLAGYALVCTPDSCYARATDSEGTVFPARLGPEADFIGAWKHVGIVVNVPSGAIMTYVDGAYAGRAVLPPTSSCTTPEPLVLGATLWGLLDEVRVEHAARNADWMKLSYENQRSGQSLLHFE